MKKSQKSSYLDLDVVDGERKLVPGQHSTKKFINDKRRVFRIGIQKS